MNIVIPCAGAGSRFSEAGYHVPKPFVDVNGYPMIRRIMENIGWKGTYFLVSQASHKELLRGALLGCDFDVVSIPIEGITDGAARTVLKAKEHIENNDLLIIANSDQVVEDVDWFGSANAYFLDNDCDCGVICFLNDHPKWSYVRLEKGRIVEVAEKRPISQIATAGVYWFRHGTFFVRAAEQMIEKNIRTNNEFYVAPAINELILDGAKVMPYMVNRMYGIGTPLDLEAYLDIHKA